MMFDGSVNMWRSQLMWSLLAFILVSEDQVYQYWGSFWKCFDMIYNWGEFWWSHLRFPKFTSKLFHLRSVVWFGVPAHHRQMPKKLIPAAVTSDVFHCQNIKTALVLRKNPNTFNCVNKALILHTIYTRQPHLKCQNVSYKEIQRHNQEDNKLTCSREKANAASITAESIKKYSKETESSSFVVNPKK